MPLDTVDDGAVPMKNSDQISTLLLPDKYVSVIAACGNVLPRPSQEDGLLDVCMGVAVAAVAGLVVRHSPLLLLEGVWLAGVVCPAVGGVVLL